MLKKRSNFSYLWKSYPDTPNSFGELILQKLQTSQWFYELINVFAIQQFFLFWWLLFSLKLLCKELKIAQIAQISQLFQLQCNDAY